MSSCPRCSEPLKTEPTYPEWCPSCDWNVVRGPAPKETMFTRLSARLVRGLHEDILRSKNSGPTTDATSGATTGPTSGGTTGASTGATSGGTTSASTGATSGGTSGGTTGASTGATIGAARVAGYVLAVATHLLAPAFLLLGLYLLTRWTLFLLLPAIVALDLAWLLRPRPVPFPDSAERLTRETAPNLFALLDRIGTEVGAPRTDVVAVTGEVNASLRTYGWRRRPVVEIGYPLWLIITPQERVALLAHEMSHSSNGDGRHGLVVGSALHSLAVLHDVTRFDWKPGDGVAHLVAEALLALLGLPVRGLLLVTELLLYRSAQRAEYRADEMAARAAGAPAVGSLLDAMATRAESALWFLSTSGHVVKPEEMWPRLRALVAGLPASELERRRRAARLEELRVDQTHPPTYLRMEWVARQDHPEPRVPATEMDAIDLELERVALRVAQAVRENAQSALYH